MERERGEGVKIPEDLRTWYSVACDKVHFATDYDAIKILIERIAAQEVELKKCILATRSYQEAVDSGPPFGDAVKAVLTLRQNADAGFAELARTRAERDSLRLQLERMREPVTREEIERPYSGSGLTGFANRVNAIVAARAWRQEKP